MTHAELSAVLAGIDRHAMAIRITGALALLLGFVQYGEAIRLGFRDRTHAIPLVAVLFDLANDASYTLHYGRWFHVVQHPFFMAEWYLIFPFTVLELVVCWQIVHFSRAEVFAGFNETGAWIMFVALAVGMYVVHRYLAAASDDYLAQKNNLLTLVLSNLGFYLLLRRRSRKGQSMLLALTLLLCAGAPQFFVHFPAMDPAFRTPQFYALGGVVTLTGWIYAVALWRAPAYRRPFPGQPDATGSIQRA